MIKDSFGALGASARDTLRGWRALLLLCALYLALLACVNRFFPVGVATAWQLAQTGVTALAPPLLLLVLLAATAHFALPGEKRPGALMRRSLRDFLKVLLLAVPVAALGLLLFYLLGKLQQHLPKVAEAPAEFARATRTLESKPAPLHWQEALMSSLWILAFGLVLPLLAAHLWLSAARDGLKPTLRRLHRVAGRAFAPRPVLVYTLGLFVFGMLPYFVLYTRTGVSNGWAELGLFGLRLVVVFLLTLLGWTITLGALARVTPADAAPVTAEAARADAPPAELPAPPPSVAGKTA